LLALEWFRELNLPCNLSKVDVLDALGLDTSDYMVVEELRHRFMFQVRKHLLAGSVLAQHVGGF